MPQHGPPGDPHGLAAGSIPFPGDTTGFPASITVGGGPQSDPGEGALSGGSFEDRLSRVRADVLALIQEDGTVTEAERLEFEKITTALQKLKADRAKQEQAALGGGPATEFIRRAAGGA